MILDKKLEYKIQQRQRDASYGEDGWAQCCQAALNKINGSGWLTAGLWCSMGENILGSYLFEKVKETERKREQNEADKKQRKQEQKDKIKQKVADVQAKTLVPYACNSGELKTMVKWFRQPGDSKLPATKVKLLQHYFLTCGRIETERNWLKEGEVAVVDGKAIDSEDAKKDH